MNLYKYLNEERISILQDGLIRFSQPQAFNDPFEFKPHLSSIGSDKYLEDNFNKNFEGLLKDEYEKQTEEVKAKISLGTFLNWIKEKHPDMIKYFRNLSTSITPALEEALHQTFENHIGVLSLSESPKNLLMWSHYANSHKGFVIEFDSTHEFFNRKKSQQDELRFIRKVEYSKLRPNFSLSELMNINDFLIKSDDWSYEQEWRMLLPLKEADAIIKTVPYDIYLFEIPFPAFKSILLGARADPQLITKVENAISDNAALNHLNIIDMHINNKNFKLDSSLRR